VLYTDTSQLVTQSSRHTVIGHRSTHHIRVLSQSTRHKWAHNKAVSWRRGSAQKQLLKTRSVCRQEGNAGRDHYK